MGTESPSAFSDVASGSGGRIFSLIGDDDVDLAGEELFDCLSLETDLDLDLSKHGEGDFDLDLFAVFLGDLNLLLPGNGECDFDMRFRDNERDWERLLGLGERVLLAGDLECFLTGDRDFDRRLGGGLLDLERLRGLLDLERRLRLTAPMERDRVLLLLRIDRERRDLGGGDLRRRDMDRLLERRPPARLTGVRDRERRTGRLDLEQDRCVLVMERDRERLPTAAPLLGDLVLERLVPRERDIDLRFFLGDRDMERDLRPPRLGDRETFFGEGLLRLFGETDMEFFRLLGDFDFLGESVTLILGVREREADLDL